MRTITMSLIIFQIIAMCTLSFAISYSKLKLPKNILILKLSMLILNFGLLIFNMNRL